jgi:hypothetical protein
MFSPEQAIIFAEAGVRAKAENIAAVIKIFMGTSLENKTSVLLVNEIRICPADRFRQSIIFARCSAPKI